MLVLTLNLALLWQDPLFGAGTAGDTALLAVILPCDGQPTSWPIAVGGGGSKDKIRLSFAFSKLLIETKN